MATRNLGQVAGLWIGTTPPTNTDLIWLDTSLNPAVHKVYANGGWNNLAQNIISTIGYANLKTLAQTTGLTLGSWYKITDNSVAYRNNVLAYAITSQRIHYVANNGNIVIDDLSSSSLAEFRVPCINNLLIDGITGDWSNNQLNFNFTEATPSNAADYFLFGKRLVNSVYQLAKFKISSFISSVTGNDLQWNNGLYINLSTLLNNRYDQVGGVTAYNTYAAKIALVDASLQTLSENYQHLISGYTDGNNVVHSDGIIDEKIADATSSAAIIGDGTNANPGKTLPSLDTTFTSSMNNIIAGDNLRKIISKCQGWFNNLKKASNIYLENYSVQSVKSYPASGDDLQTAVSKIGWWLNYIENIKLPSNWQPTTLTIEPILQPGDTYDTAFAKIQNWFNQFWISSTSVFSSRMFAKDGSSPKFAFNENGLQIGVEPRYSRINEGISEYVEAGQQLIDNSALMASFLGHSYTRNVTQITQHNYSARSIPVRIHTIHANESSNPSFGNGLSSNGFEKYAIWGDSIFSKVQSLGMQTYYHSSDGLTVDINQYTPAIIFIKGLIPGGTGAGSSDITFNIGTLRNGQTFKIIILSGYLGNVIFSAQSGNAFISLVNETFDPYTDETGNNYKTTKTYNSFPYITEYICFSKDFNNSSASVLNIGDDNQTYYKNILMRIR